MIADSGSFVRLDISGKGDDISGYTIRVNDAEVAPISLRVDFTRDKKTVAKLMLEVDEITVDADALAAMELLAGVPAAERKRQKRRHRKGR